VATTRPKTSSEICNCEPSSQTRTYYVWLIDNRKQRVLGVTELDVTTSEVLLRTRSDETVVVPRRDVFMVTCDICSPPPCS
jgi:hypothetical protein